MFKKRNNYHIILQFRNKFCKYINKFKKFNIDNIEIINIEI